MFDRILPQMWLTLPKEQRDIIALAFNLPRSSITEVRDSTVISDGYNYEDLGGITTEKMNAYIGSEETFQRGWEITLSKVRAELNPPQVMAAELVNVVELTQPKPTKNGKKTK